MCYVLRDEVFVHPFSDNSGIALYNSSNFEVVCVNFNIHCFMELLRGAPFNDNPLNHSSKVISELAAKEMIERSR